MIRIADLMRRLPAIAALDARLSDPDWHPTEQERAEAEHALALDRAVRQLELRPIRAPLLAGSHRRDNADAAALGEGGLLRTADRVSAACEEP